MSWSAIRQASTVVCDKKFDNKPPLCYSENRKAGIRMRAKDFISDSLMSDMLEDMYPSDGYMVVHVLNDLHGTSPKTVGKHMVLAEIIDSNSFSHYHNGRVVVVPAHMLVPSGFHRRRYYIRPKHVVAQTKRNDWPITDENRFGSDPQRNDFGIDKIGLEKDHVYWADEE